MFQRKRVQLVLAVATVALLCASRDVHAYYFQAQCDFVDDPVKWGGNFRMYRDVCSMPDNSDRDGAYYNAGFQWSQFQGLMDWNWSYDDNCSITFENGRNETAVVPRSDISGANGLTQYDYNWSTCVFAGAQYTETDVMVADDMSYANEDETFSDVWLTGVPSAQQGRVVLLHEFGHVLGLGHADWFDVMRTYAPEPLVGGTGDHAEPFPDDANGIRALYSNYPAQYNVFASAQELFDDGTNQGNIRAIEQSWPSSVCPNDPITVYYTFGNNGTGGLGNLPFRIFINTVPTATGGGWDVFRGSIWSLHEGTMLTDFGTGTVPMVPAGTYYVLWEMGPWGIEFNQGDNVVHSAYTLDVEDCCSPSCRSTCVCIPAKPTVQASISYLYGYDSPPTITLGWKNGDGEATAVFMAATSTGAPAPVDGTVYLQNAADPSKQGWGNSTFGQGTQIGTSEWYCVYNGLGSGLGGGGVQIDGLQSGTIYRVMAVSYNGYSGGVPVYLTATTSNNPANYIRQASNVTATSCASSNGSCMTLGWQNGNGNATAVFMAKDGSGNPALDGADGLWDGYQYTDTMYHLPGSQSSIFGQGTQLYNNWYCVYNGAATSATVAGLQPGATYRVAAVSYTGTWNNPTFLRNPSNGWIGNPTSFVAPPIGSSGVPLPTAALPAVPLGGVIVFLALLLAVAGRSRIVRRAK